MINYEKNKITNALAVVSQNIGILSIPFNVAAQVPKYKNIQPELLFCGQLANLIGINAGIGVAVNLLSKHLLQQGKITQNVAINLNTTLPIAILILTLGASLVAIAATIKNTKKEIEEIEVLAPKNAALAMTGAWMLTPVTLLADAAVNCVADKCQTRSNSN